MAEPIPLPVVPGEKVKTFPPTPGVYLMKDVAGNVIYVGKAKSLRNRASHYFTKEAAENLRTQELVKHICDIDFIPTDTEVDALLKEARLIKDIQPKFNKDLKDDKSFPYLQIRTREEYPRVEFTRTPRRRGVRLYGPFTSANSLRAAIQVLQRVFQFRTCTLDIKGDDDRWRWFRPCLLHSIRQCSAPCNFRISKEEYRKQVRKLILVLEGKKAKLIREMEAQMREASAAMMFEKAARIRDEIQSLHKLELRGDVKNDDQPEVFPLDPKKGLAG
jgi:excinuclease ABC subunit C